MQVSQFHRFFFVRLDLPVSKGSYLCCKMIFFRFSPEIVLFIFSSGNRRLIRSFFSFSKMLFSSCSVFLLVFDLRALKKTSLFLVHVLHRNRHQQRADFLLFCPLLSLLLLKTLKGILLFSTFSNRELNFPFMGTETFSMAICSSLFFILPLLCVSLFFLLAFPQGVEALV